MSQSSEKRWYDQDSNISAAVNLTLDMPNEILIIISDGVVLLAEREFQAKETLKNFKSLGTEKVLAIYRSKEKKRTYDQNPTVHKMVNYLYLMSPENQNFMAKHIILIMKLVQEYLQLCAVNQIEPQKTDLEEMTQSYANNGNEAAQKVLSSITRKFLRHVEERASQLNRPSSVVEEDDRDRQNMRISQSS